MTWQPDTEDPRLKDQKCTDCNLLFSQAIVKGSPCCGGKQCRIKASQRQHARSPEEKELALERRMNTIEQRSPQRSEVVSANRTRGQKKRQSEMSTEEKHALVSAQELGRIAAKNDAAKRQKYLDKRTDRIKHGFKVHQHWVKAFPITGGWYLVKVYSRGWEHRTISLLVQIYGTDELYGGFKLTNDVFLCKGDNCWGDFVTASEQAQIFRDLKTPSIHFQEGGWNLRHDLDHHVEIKCYRDLERFVLKLADTFDFNGYEFLETLPPDGVDQIAIETKSFRMAAAKKGADWLDRFLANALSAINTGGLLYLVFAWTETSCTLYHITGKGRLQQLGVSLLFSASSNVAQDIKYHTAGFQGTGIVAPINFKRAPFVETPPLKDGYVDKVCKSRLYISLTDRPANPKK